MAAYQHYATLEEARKRAKTLVLNILTFQEYLKEHSISELTVGQIHTYARQRDEYEKLTEQYSNLIPNYSETEYHAAQEAEKLLQAAGISVPAELAEILAYGKARYSKK